ncbi:MAG: transglycosylase SLT domain-containing protein [gamma proteobacterium symbiont of Bathyaustriella thionipta]|nr:transglycosylase SLT domain-containing protein [gamma proteobacterium symbiont of Bathyaustriella thionipta]MCU7956425.1 transglycosylase SLT domain-containing protein [gamma proteobacterium symbiont of Bathyaustriella thionipta]MCU7967532.1 transglycosylase SLT domain-containing protein [gamma proteobacterium symbiont of Bathyaustriella thionipta]
MTQPSLANSISAQTAINDPYKRERISFLKAEVALQKKQYSSYKKYYKKLDNYPLQAYLKYKEYRNKLSRLTEQQVLQFFKDYETTPYEAWLRTVWLDKKAKNKQWQQYLNAYTPQKSITRQCFYLNALLKTGKKEQAFKQTPKLWLTGKSQPKSCDPVFNAFKNAGKMTPELLWSRIKLAMKKGRTSLTGYLAKSLSKDDQQWIKEWTKIYRKPEQVLKSKLLQQSHPIKSTIQIHAVERMANKKPEAAIKLLASLQQKHPFTVAEQDKMYRAIGMKLAYRHGDGAWFWLDKISDKNSDETIREWRVRSAIREANWDAIYAAITRLSKEEQKDFRWQYWLASSKTRQGKKTEALKDYYQLAQNRSYYGFLAADKMDMPYEFQNAPLTPDSKMLTTITQHPGILRAREFYLLDRKTDARREWYFATRKQMSNDERAIAAKVAQQWGWHNRAIITMAHTDQRNDIELRFPVLQKERVKKYSQKQQLQPAYTLAVIRRESAFATDARSRVGALGLMQIMPATGKVIASKLKVKYNSKNQLLIPETNVKFGTKYLNMMLDKFHDQPALASAAYNAGGHRVRAWQPKDKDMSADRWIESIPFKETREYVSSILAYTAIYERQLGLEQTRLTAMMPDVPKK